MKKFKRNYVSVNVDVDVNISDIIEEIDTEDLIAELNSRNSINCSINCSNYGQLQNLKTDIQKRMAIALFFGVPIHSANDFDRIVSELKDYYIC